jgi:hypothetical protein
VQGKGRETCRLDLPGSQLKNCVLCCAVPCCTVLWSPSFRETWICMDLMDRGNLAAAVRQPTELSCAVACCAVLCYVSPLRETWICMDLMDGGNLAAAIRQGAFLDSTGEGLRPVSHSRVWACVDQ